jgi:hypothetical protein
VPVNTDDTRKRGIGQRLGTPVSKCRSTVRVKEACRTTFRECTVGETPCPSIAYLLYCNEKCRSNYQGPPACKERAEYISTIFVQQHKSRAGPNIHMTFLTLSTLEDLQHIYTYFVRRDYSLHVMFICIGLLFLHLLSFTLLILFSSCVSSSLRDFASYSLQSILHSGQHI